MRKTSEIFIENLITIRKSKGLSQIALAEKAGISIGLIGEIETGNRNPTLTTIDKIAAALEIPVYQLFFDSKTMKVPCAPSESVKAQIIALLNQLS